MKKHIFTTLFLCCFIGFSSLYAQNTLNVSGNSAKINGMTFDYSIGEMTLVSTEHQSNFIITQGLLQPNQSASGQSTSPSDLNQWQNLVKVYPNPSDNLVYAEWQADKTADCSYQLFDATGKVVLKGNYQQVSGNNKIRLELQSLAAGTYYLMLTGLVAEDAQEQFSFKIQKVK
ncbi:MAG: T9SS type A sorting domain-containing protein [Chitinophagaceae bacterium]|jgi:hypothetical protein